MTAPAIVPSQEVCPWNSFAEPTGETAFLPRDGIDCASPIEPMGVTQEELSRRFRGSVVKRTMQRGLLRITASMTHTAGRRLFAGARRPRPFR